MTTKLVPGIIALIMASVSAGAVIADPSQPLRSIPLEQDGPAPQVLNQLEGRFPRNFRLQPPLIPHGIEQYQLDTRTNQCLSCHDWTNAGTRNAPTLSMTHYLNRNGRQLDQIAGTRWFCNQCHVPQAATEPLVGNSFKPSTELK